MSSLLKPLIRDRGPSVQQEIPIISELYRGYKVEAELFRMPVARQTIDRLWAMRIYEAPDSAARAAVLEDERRLIEKTKPQKKSGRKPRFETEPGASPLRREGLTEERSK